MALHALYEAAFHRMEGNWLDRSLVRAMSA